MGDHDFYSDCGVEVGRSQNDPEPLPRRKNRPRLTWNPRSGLVLGVTTTKFATARELNVPRRLTALRAIAAGVRILVRPF